MDWLQFSLDTTKDQVDQLSDSLTEAGAVAITLAEDPSQPIFELNPEHKPLWEHVKLIALFDVDADLLAIDPAILAQGKWQRIAEQDWLHKWKEDLKPMLFADKLWICPSWCEIPDPTAINIILDPEMAFGTGSHPTTALCLEWIVQNIQAGNTVIDYGCGSGILAIAAGKFGAQPLYGTDIDQIALDVTQVNASKNHVQIATFLPQQMPSIKADVLIANILAGPLTELAPTFVELLKPGGKLVLSGILETQTQQTIAAYQQWFSGFKVQQQGEWVRITAIII